MIRLTKEEENAVALAQLGAAAENLGNVSRWWTRFYGVLRPLADGRLRFLVVAARKVGEVRWVADWIVGERGWRAESCFDWRGMAGYLVDWSSGPDKGAPGTLYWRDEFDVPHLPWAPIVNAPACEGSRWEYLAKAALRVGVKSVPRFLAVGARHPRVELMAKAGFPDRWWNPRVLLKMRDDAGFGRFVAENAERITAQGILPRDAVEAWRAGKSGEDLAHWCDLKRKWHGCALYGVPMEDAERYVRKLEEKAAELSLGCAAGTLGAVIFNVTRQEYSQYLALARSRKRDLRDRGVAFPRDFFDARDKLRAEERKVAVAAERKRRLEEYRAKREKIRRVAAIATLTTKLALPKGWRVVPLLTQDALLEEGRRMHNCIGNGVYASALEDGRAICFSIQGPKGLRSDLELGLAGRVMVRQLYSAFNRDPHETARVIAAHVARAVGRHLKRKEEKKERKTA